MLHNAPVLAQDGPKFYLNATAVDPDDSSVVYTSNAEMWKSTDSGATWNSVGRPIIAWSIVINRPNSASNPGAEKIVYAATQERGILWSTDDLTWTEGNGLSGRVASVAAHSDGETVFAGADEAIYISRDRGRNWEVLSTDVGLGKTTGLIIDSANPQVMYAAKQSQGVYRSVDGGLSWELGNSGLTSLTTFDLDLHPQNPSILYLTTTDGVFQSVDAGVTWARLATPARTTELDIDPTNPDRMIVTTAESGILRSLDGGQTWTPVNTGLGDVVLFVSIAIAHDGSGMVYAGTSENGLFTSTDFGDTWNQNYTLPDTAAPPPASPPPPDPTSLSVRIVNRNGEKVEFGETAYFDVIVRNSGSNIAQNAQVQLSWQQVDKGPYAMTARWSGGGCTDNVCSLGNLPVNGEVVITVEGRTGDAYNWVGPFSLLASATADNADPASASIRVDVSRTIVTIESGGGGTSGPSMLSILLLLTLSLYASNDRIPRRRNRQRIVERSRL
jgi:photosystem II stability/assembly factor-like uncharacterized protein